MKIHRSLLRDCARQKRKAQHKLYEVSYGTLMGIAWRYVNHEEDAAELVNQAFLKILNGIEKFIRENPEDKFEFWIRRIMVNTVIDDFRKNKKHKQLSEAVDFNDGFHENPAIDWNEAESNLNVEELKAMLDRLGELRKSIFNLYAIDGYTHKEIAEMLNTTEGNSKWHVSMARKELQAMIEASLMIAQKVGK